MRARRIFFPFVLFFLLLGLLSGLARGGVVGLHQLGSKHFLIFLYGFFGGLLSLERAIGFRSAYLLVVPFLIFIGCLGYILSGVSWLLLPGAIAFVVPNIKILISSKSFLSLGFILSSVLFALGTLFYFSPNTYYTSALCFVSFIVFYVLSERIELARIIGIKKSDKIFFSVLSLVSLSGIPVSLVNLNYGISIVFLPLSAFAVWFISKDISRRTIKMKGLTRYSALSMILAYLWLFVGGVELGIFRFWGEGIHSITLGFIFSMIFAHAPTIFPSLMEIKFIFSPILYLPLFLLHFSVFLRNISHFLYNLKSFSLVLNFVSIVLFFILFFYIVISEKIKQDKKLFSKSHL